MKNQTSIAMVLAMSALAAILAVACGEVVTSKSVLASKTIGPEGGSVTFERVKVDVPPEALAREVTLTIAVSPSPPDGNIGPAYEIDAGDAEFAKAVTITYTVDPGDLTADTPLEHLMLAWVEDGKWSALPASYADVASGTVIGEATHFSVWGAIPEPPIPPPPECEVKADCAPQDCMTADCEEGECVYAAIPECPAECDENADCDSGFHCQDGKCVPDVCIPDCSGKECGDDNCGGSCGDCTNWCPDAEHPDVPYSDPTLCHEGKCAMVCCPNCFLQGKECGPDGCSGLCGKCDEGLICNMEYKCVPDDCEPQCAGKDCGPDGCGGSCGSCPCNFECDSGSCKATCALDCQGKMCGDGGCGCPNLCGTCGANETCTNDGQCVCVPDCAGKECGGDGCGGSCGSCVEGPGTCLPGGKCGTAVPECTGKQCGPDGAGGSCGECAMGKVCDGIGQCTAACFPDCADKQCGPNGCGTWCGLCGSGGSEDPTYGMACNGGGVCEECPPQCEGKKCGPDACGAWCGGCKVNQICLHDEGACTYACLCSGTACTSDGFESVFADGWSVHGDVQVVANLGTTFPPEGQLMALVGNGLSVLGQGGEMHRGFCPPEGSNLFHMRWKFYSEELPEWCGSIFQDAITVTLSNGFDVVHVLDFKVDDVCNPNECGYCGSQFVGLYPSDIQFDIGGVLATPWQEVNLLLPDNFTLEPVTVSITASDKGDSIFVSAILIDDIHFGIATCVPDCTGKECGGDGCGGSCGSCEEGASCDAGLCKPSGPCSVWDYITEAELDAAGQCFMDFWLEPPEPLFSALDGEGHLFGQDLALKSEFFMVETIADEKALTLTVPCEGGLVVKIWADKPLGGTEEGLDHAVSDPACLQDGSCSCDPLCIFVEVSMDGQPAVSATGGTVMFGCDPNDCDCGFMSYAFREAKLTFADALGQKQFLSVHALGPDWMPKDEWIQAVTAEP